MPCLERYLSILTDSRSRNKSLIFGGVDKLGIEAGECVVYYLKEWDVYLVSERSEVFLKNVENWTHNFFLEQSCEEVVVEVWLLLVVRNLSQISEK